MSTSRRGRSRTGGRGSPRGPRRESQWLDTEVASAIATGGQFVDSLLATVVDQDAMGMTIVRTIIDLYVVPSTLSGAVGVMNINFGLMVADQEQFASSVLPDPNNMTDRPVGGWYWRHRLIIQDHTTAGSVPAMVSVHADLRGKRKIGHGEPILIGNNNLSSGTAFSIDCFGLIRTLVLLP